ncbi:MAG: hypothetical protein J5867_11525 [Prevotella sp.]|nr:hypothetical protein [Prevotella sp.]
MKRISYYMVLTALSATILTACSEWSDHFDESGISTDKVSIYNGDIVSYMKGTADVSQFSNLLQEAGVYDSTFADNDYTFIVCSNDIFKTGEGNITNRKTFAQYSVCDMAVAPSTLKDGYGLLTRSGKNVWVYGDNDAFRFDQYGIEKVVKTNNGYVYYIRGVLPIRNSVYEYLNSLGENYSRFRELVAKFEEPFFDREHSAAIGVNDAGMTVYDSIITVRNTLMDRYTAEGVNYWDMRSESYKTTMFIPNNEQIDNAINNAMDSIPVWLNRPATDADLEKFEKWIVKACFVNSELGEDEVSASAPDFRCVDGYMKVIDTQADVTKYKDGDAAWWRPRVQTVDVSSKVNLSNGVAYYCTNLKIPNHVVIYRVKARFYELWNAMTEAEKETYFRWNHWTDQMIINDAQGEFTLSSTLPTMYYHVLTAVPDEEAIADSLHCSVNYDALLYDEATNTVSKAYMPAGEYYLRMGFKHSLTYSVSIFFNDSLLVKDMVLYAQGSNFHFDRGAASEVPHYGQDGIAYGEGFDPDDWIELDPKAIAYDTDGYTVGVVNLKQSGNFTITVDSYDNSYLYNASAGRNKNNVTQLMMYHWCLRPTHNNY